MNLEKFLTSSELLKVTYYIYLVSLYRVRSKFAWNVSEFTSTLMRFTFHQVMNWCSHHINNRSDNQVSI